MSESRYLWWKELRTDFHHAIFVLRKHAPKYWSSEMKTVEEVIDFLDFIINDVDGYDDLHEKAKGFLEVIRRTHNDWVKRCRLMMVDAMPAK
jgi:hypothetical protein